MPPAACKNTTLRSARYADVTAQITASRAGLLEFGRNLAAAISSEMVRLRDGQRASASDSAKPAPVRNFRWGDAAAAHGNAPSWRQQTAQDGWSARTAATARRR